MENIFIDNPITVNVLGIDSFNKPGNPKRIKQQIVWINTRDEKIIKLWKNNDIKNLKKRYGNAISLITGGDEDSGDLGNDIDDDVLDEITFDDDDFDELLKDDVTLDDSKQVKEKIKFDKPFVFVKNIFIFPEDKVSEFKKKIYAATGIPPYRQHLWYEFKGKTFPLSYKIIHEVPLGIDIRTLYKNTNFFEGIPVDTYWYSIKDNLSIIALDEFQLLDQIYYKHGVTEYYVVDLDDFINPIRGNLERLIKKDLYSVELIYYSFILKYWPHITLTVFGEYVKNEEVLFEKYPDLAPNISNVKTQYQQETKLIGDNYIPVLDEKKWDVPLYVSITYSVISVTEQYITPGSIVYLRNLFDVFALSERVTYIICNLEFDGRQVLLTKKYKTTKVPNINVAVNALLLNVNIPEHGSIHLIINKKGNYKIESKWREDQYFNFAMIYSQVETYVKPVIETINSFGKLVSSNPLTIIKNDNSVFTDINISMFWKFNMSQKMFDNVKNILLSYVNAGIMIRSTSGVSNSLDYYFTKGMYKYEMGRYKMLNPVQNQYQYLTDASVKNKHDTLITKRKKLSITHRFSDIKIEFYGLKEQEFITFYVYILRLLESIPRVKGEKASTTVKKLKQLKEKDPLLYEFKKVYDSPLVYSKLCQQQKQPIMYNEPGKNRVKFWNFTTNEPAYYGCPNPKFPYINFITHAHPKGFCIPCCYKLPPSTNVKDKKGRIYKVCMEEKKYEKEKKSLAKSRYIMSYGKDIEVGRLSRLPENTLEPLFYDTFSTKSEGIDEECIKEKGYYLFGVPQHVKNVSNIGFLFCISHALGKNIIDFIAESLVKIRERCECWNILLGGTVSKHFPTFKIFLEEVRDVFIGNKMSSFEHWNYLFMDITKIYWDVFVVHFADDSTLNQSTNINLQIPGYIQYWDDYVSTSKHLVVIERDNQFYPIYIIYKDIFFKIGTIENKLYEHTAPLIKEIHNLASYHIKQTKYKEFIDLHLLKRFVKNSKYNIEIQFVNTSNFCYGVLIKYIPSKKVTPFYDIPEKSKIVNLDDENYVDLVETFNTQVKKSKEKSFYVPIKESYYKTDGTHISFTAPTNKNTAEWDTLYLFITQLNDFITKYTKHELPSNPYNKLFYPLIKVEKWLLYLGKIIGFRCNSFNYMFAPKPPEFIKKIEDTPNGMIKLRYDPFRVNEILYKRSKPARDTRYKKIAKSLYDNYLYPILIIELINVMDKQRNTSIRKKLVNIINKFTLNNTQSKELYDLLNKYPSDYKVIQKLLFDNLVSAPSSKKKIEVDAFVSKKKFNKRDLLEIIENSVFNFDKKLFDKFKSMSHKDLVKELITIFSKLTVNSEPVFNDGFPNMIMSCEINHPYCKNKKLMIKKDKLYGLLDIMASDILNPVKSKYIFSPIFVKNTIDQFKFIIRPDEHITISI